MATFTISTTSTDLNIDQSYNLSLSMVGVLQTGTLNSLLPSQTGQAGKVLGTDGANTSWVTGVGGGGGSSTWGGITGTLSDQIDLRTVLDAKQPNLFSGTNIKTINSASILGSGDITISASPGGSTTQIQFNNAGVFAGDSGFTWDVTKKLLKVGDAILFNTAVGINSLINNTTGSYNTSFGNNALKANTSGYCNVAVGNDALATNSSGLFNTAIGINSSAYNTTGSSNTTIGINSLNYNQVGSNNIAIGTGSGGSSTSNPLFTVNNSCYIGGNTKSGTTSPDNETVIGYTAVGNGNNSVTIGNNLVTKNYISGQLNVTNNTTTNVAVVIKGASSQTANLQEWKNSSGANLGYISANGDFVLENKGIYANLGNGLRRSNNGGTEIICAAPYFKFIDNGGNFLFGVQTPGILDISYKCNLLGDGLIYRPMITSTHVVKGESYRPNTNQATFADIAFYGTDIYSGSPLTITNRATVYIDSFPVQNRASATFSGNKWAQWTADGDHWIQGGNLAIGGTSNQTSRLYVEASSTSNPTKVTKAIASQAANLDEWQDPSGNVKASVTKDFELQTVVGSGAPSTTPIDGAMYVDTTNSRLYVRSGGNWKYTLLI